MLTQELIRELFIYDPTIPQGLRWRITRSNRIRVNSPAGSLDGRGYYHTWIGATRYKNHRIIYFLWRGQLPARIDHINRDKIDNRIENLRAATNSTNMANSNKRVDNTSGYKGVWFFAKAKKFQAYIKVSQSRKHLGLFLTSIEAAKAYDRAALKHFGEFAKTNFPRSDYE